MQKTKRTLKILIAVLVAVIVLAVAIALINANQNRQQEQEDEAAQIHLGNLSAPVYFAFNCGGGDEESAFVLADETWYYEADRDMPMDQELLTAIAEQLTDLMAVRKLDINEELSYYGLDDPTYSLKAEDGEGKTLSLLIGNVLDGDRYYVMEPGGDSIYTIEEDLPVTLKYPLLEMMTLEEFDTITEADILSYDISDPDGRTVYFEKMTEMDANGKDTYSWLIRTDDGLVPAESITVTDAEGEETTAQAYGDSIRGMFTRFFFYAAADFNCTDAELKEYGLKEPLKLVITYTAKNDQRELEEREITLLFGGEFVVPDDVYGEETLVYTMQEGSKAVNSMTARRVSALRDALDALCVSAQ